jgi:hypothetical protein
MKACELYACQLLFPNSRRAKHVRVVLAAAFFDIVRVRCLALRSLRQDGNEKSLGVGMRRCRRHVERVLLDRNGYGRAEAELGD